MQYEWPVLPTSINFNRSLTDSLLSSKRLQQANSEIMLKKIIDITVTGCKRGIKFVWANKKHSG